MVQSVCATKQACLYKLNFQHETTLTTASKQQANGASGSYYFRDDTTRNSTVKCKTEEFPNICTGWTPAEALARVQQN
jgi:hypothetical protein